MGIVRILEELGERKHGQNNCLKTFLIKKIYFIFVYMSLCGHVHAGVQSGQKRAPDLLQLELQAVVSSST